MNLQVMCHCVSQDCSNCPMKNVGTAGILAEYDFFHKFDNNKDKNTEEERKKNKK